MKKTSIRNMVLTGLFIALGMVLPFLTGQIPNIGEMLLPMHIPVLLCGFVCGWSFGLFAGFITPLLRSMVFGRLPIYPTAVAMAFELAVYGVMAGILYKRLPKKNRYIFMTLILSMICGRIVWGMVSYVLVGLGGTAFTWQMFMAGAFSNALPGIVIQIIAIPLVIIALKKGNLIHNE